MLPRVRRLQQRKAFDPLYRSGRMVRGKMLTLRYIAAERIEAEIRTLNPAESHDVPSRIAVIVSKKVSRKAVERNRIKRRIRHQLLQMLDVVAPNYYIAISANRPHHRPPTQKALQSNRSPALLSCTAPHIQRELSQLFRQANLMLESE